MGWFVDVSLTVMCGRLRNREDSISVADVIGVYQTQYWVKDAAREVKLTINADHRWVSRDACLVPTIAACKLVLATCIFRL